MMFDGNITHGGFVDRLKGIVSFYELSKRNKWGFKIYHPSPFELSVFFKENEVLWKTDEIIRRFPSSRPIHFFDQPLHHVDRLVKRFQWNCDYHIYSNVDFLKQLYPDYSRQQLDERWGNCFKELFHLSDELENEVQAYLAENVDTIGVHFRFANLINDFEDTFSFNLSHERREEIINSCLVQLEKIIIEYPGYAVYLFTDSHKFMELAKSKFSTLKLTPGIPVHTDLEKGYQGHKKTLLDFVLLSRMSMVYFVKTQEMYNSNFSRYASKLNSCLFQQVNI